ncbi:MAG: hypothetical protein FJ399_00860 [Verrucomicrobia bacterium]|nr:hypothetical protein [Verrucomicrobiota bacterium]
MAALDAALDVFAKSAGSLSADDYQLKSQLEQVRSKVYKAGTVTPFAAKPAAPDPAAPPDLTQAPWFKK